MECQVFFKEEPDSRSLSYKATESGFGSISSTFASLARKLLVIRIIERIRRYLDVYLWGSLKVK